MVGLAGTALPQDIDYFTSSGATDVLAKSPGFEQFNKVIEDLNNVAAY